MSPVAAGVYSAEIRRAFAAAAAAPPAAVAAVVLVAIDVASAVLVDVVDAKFGAIVAT